MTLVHAEIFHKVNGSRVKKTIKIEMYKDLLNSDRIVLPILHAKKNLNRRNEASFMSFIGLSAFFILPQKYNIVDFLVKPMFFRFKNIGKDKVGKIKYIIESQADYFDFLNEFDVNVMKGKAISMYDAEIVDRKEMRIVYPRRLVVRVDDLYRRKHIAVILPLVKHNVNDSVEFVPILTYYNLKTYVFTIGVEKIEI